MIEFKPGMPIKEGVQALILQGSLLTAPSITLSELQGKPVIINFWQPGAVHASREMPAF